MGRDFRSSLDSGLDPGPCSGLSAFGFTMATLRLVFPGSDAPSCLRRKTLA